MLLSAKDLGLKNEQLMSALPEPEKAAANAGLIYVADTEAGLRRRKCGRGFTYFDEKGRRVAGKPRERLAALAIPPAWTDVWIAPQEQAHILATGRDEAGRKQYIYHPLWHQQREHANFNRLLPFGEALPQLRAALDSDLRMHSLSHERVCALVIRLMQSTLARVGNPEYAVTNETYGLTTLTDEHLQLSGESLHFEFVGKSGKTFTADLRDGRAARALRALQELPGQHLFQYLDQHEQPRALRSDDINDYLRQHTGGDFSAKDIRTWGGSCITLGALLERGPEASDYQSKRAINVAIKLAAKRLNNTLAVCRRHYVHPGIAEQYAAGSLDSFRVESASGIDDESSLLKLLQAVGNSN